MLLENVSIDAADPRRLGRFWEAMLGCHRLTDTPELVETRFDFAAGAFLDLCLARVVEPVPPSPRLHLDLAGGERQLEVVDRAIALGACLLDLGQGDAPWVVLADPESNPFCVMESRPEYEASGAIAALPLDSADPERDLAFWTAATGWRRVAASAPAALRHPSGAGPLLELCPQSQPKPAGVKNRLHLDVRLEPGEDGDRAVARLVALGGAELRHPWGDLPWRVLTDPSGNELCVLPATSSS